MTDQVGAVVPGLLLSAALLGLFGLGFGTLVKNQVAAILLTIGGTLILEGLLMPWPGPSSTTTSTGSPMGPAPRWPATSPGASVVAATAEARLPPPDLVAGRPGAAGLGPRPLTIGYFTTFRRDVT